MKRVCGHTVADDLCVNTRPALFRAFESLQDHDARAFAYNETVAIPFKRPGSMRRVVVARRESSHRSKSRHAHRRNCRFRTAANHQVGITALNDLEAIADRMRAC